MTHFVFGLADSFPFMVYTASIVEEEADSHLLF